MIFSKLFWKKFRSVILDVRLNTFVNRPIVYNIDWRVNNFRDLQKFLKEQLSSGLAQQIVSEQEWSVLSNDQKVIRILSWTRWTFKYKTDQEVWGSPEVWETFEQAYENREMDCETGSMIILTLARLAGVPSNQIFLRCGLMKGGIGHAYVVYTSDLSGQRYVLDWCWNYDPTPVAYRLPLQYRTDYVSRWFDVNDTYSLGKFNKEYFGKKTRWD